MSELQILAELQPYKEGGILEDFGGSDFKSHGLDGSDPLESRIPAVDGIPGAPGFKSLMDETPTELLPCPLLPVSKYTRSSEPRNPSLSGYIGFSAQSFNIPSISCSTAETDVFQGLSPLPSPAHSPLPPPSTCSSFTPSSSESPVSPSSSPLPFSESPLQSPLQ